MSFEDFDKKVQFQNSTLQKIIFFYRQKAIDMILALSKKVWVKKYNLNAAKGKM